MKDKRGVSNHIEMILASTVFILFFFFVMMFLKPYKTDTLTTTLVDGIDYNLDRLSLISVNKAFINVTGTDSSCYNVSSPNSANKVIVTDLKGEKINSFCSEGRLIIDSAEKMYYIYFSDNFSVKDDSIKCTESTSKLGGIYTFDAIYYDKLDEIEANYYLNYSASKKDFGVSSQFDFSIESDILSMTTYIPESVEVIAKEYNKKVIYNNGTVVNTVFLIKVW